MAEVHFIMGIQATVDPVSLLSIGQPAPVSYFTIVVNFARIIHGAPLAGFIAGIIDPDHGSRSFKNNRRAGSSTNSFAARLTEPNGIIKAPLIFF